MRSIYKVVLALLVLLICSCSQQEDQTEDAFSGLRKVSTITAVKKDISSYLEFSGKLESQQVVNISPSIPLQIEKILVDRGDKVEQGQLLIEMDRNELVRTEVQMENLKKNYERMKELKRTGSIDLQSFDEVETAYDVARSAYESVLENTEIRSPFRGIVTFIAQKEGDTYNNMFEPALIRIVNLEAMKVVMDASDRDIAAIETGQEALIMNDSRDITVPGQVTYVAPEADKLSGLYRVEIELPNPGNILKHNQFVRIKIHTVTYRNALVIPQAALFERDLVFIVADSTARLKEVVTGIENEDEIQVLKGIDPGDEVVVTGNIGLTEGEKVEQE